MSVAALSGGDDAPPWRLDHLRRTPSVIPIRPDVEADSDHDCFDDRSRREAPVVAQCPEAEQKERDVEDDAGDDAG